MAKKASESKKSTLKSTVKAVAKAVSKAVEKAVKPKANASAKTSSKTAAQNSSKKVAAKEVSKKVEVKSSKAKVDTKSAKEAVKVKAKAEKVVKSKKVKDEDDEKVINSKVSSKNPLSKHAPRVSPRSLSEKPTLMTKKGSSEPQDQGDLLIEKAREEMASINEGARQAEKAAKVKPIKIERGNSADEKAKWLELNKRHGKEKAAQYKMSDSYEALKPIQHKVLGWGFILTNENNRLEVLFENGIKMLISNYKPS